MATMVEAIMSLMPGADPMLDFAVVDHLDGKGPILQEWRRSEPKPTDEQIAAEMARLGTLPAPSRKPTLEDLIAVLTPDQRSALEANLAVETKLRD
jgi:XkdW protein